MYLLLIVHLSPDLNTQSHLLAPPTSSITIEVSLPWKYMETVGGKEGREGGKGQKHPLLLEP